MLEKIDDRVLWLTSQFVKKFNWLTGKDNFFLARGCCIVCSFLCWINAINNQSVRWIFAFSGAVIFPFIFWVVGVIEKISEEERLAGVKKNYSGFAIDRNIRPLNLFLLIFNSIHLLFLPSDISNYNRCIVWAQFFSTAVLYLVAVDKPPYSRSRAWEWMKGWLKAILSPLPTLKPVPVPVPVAPGKN
jgi:hypothetical protein